MHGLRFSFVLALVTGGLAAPAALAAPAGLDGVIGGLYTPYLDVVDGTQGGLTREQLAQFRADRGCLRKVEAAQKKFRPDDEVAHPSLELHPAMTRNGQGVPSIRIAELGWICTRYDQTLAESALELAVQATHQLTRVIAAKGLDENATRAMSQETIRWLTVGKAECEVAFAEAAKVFRAEDTVSIEGKRLPFGDLGSPCALFDEARPHYEAAWEKRSAPLYELYRGAGIGGDRLELFVEYGSPSDGGWLARGCQDYVTDVNALKSAKVLFHWLEGNDGYTVRKFAFSGDKYKLTVQSFATEARAYAGCR